MIRFLQQCSNEECQRDHTDRKKFNQKKVQEKVVVEKQVELNDGSTQDNAKSGDCVKEAAITDPRKPVRRILSN